MKRRTFFKHLGALAGAALVAPKMAVEALGTLVEPVRKVFAGSYLTGFEHDMYELWAEEAGRRLAESIDYEVLDTLEKVDKYQQPEGGIKLRLGDTIQIRKPLTFRVETNHDL